MNDEYRIQREIHRMMELLRFSPNKEGVFIARCAPKYDVLPFLKEYFTARFGETAWTIIDEKRRITLSRRCGEEAVISELPTEEDAFFGELSACGSAYGEVCGDTCGEAGSTGSDSENSDEWEELWKHYHKTINNESRKNPGLQRQLMPKRYWKYLPEV